MGQTACVKGAPGDAPLQIAWLLAMLLQVGDPWNRRHPAGNGRDLSAPSGMLSV
jgi:hypothetical protein